MQNRELIIDSIAANGFSIPAAEIIYEESIQDYRELSSNNCVTEDFQEYLLEDADSWSEITLTNLVVLEKIREKPILLKELSINGLPDRGLDMEKFRDYVDQIVLGKYVGDWVDDKTVIIRDYGG